MPGRGEPQEAQKCHSTFAVHKPEVSVFSVEGHSGMGGEAEKTVPMPGGLA